MIISKFHFGNWLEMDVLSVSSQEYIMKNGYYNKKSIDELNKLLDGFNAGIVFSDINYRKIPVTTLSQDIDGVILFNSIYNWLKNSDFNSIVRTPSGGISIRNGNFNPPCWDNRKTSSSIELTIITIEKAYRVQFRRTDVDIDGKQKILSGRQAFRYFQAMCSNIGIDMEKYAVQNGFEVKKNIPEPLIWADRLLLDQTYENVHHIDLHSAYPSGLVETHPEFRPVVEKLYNRRKTNQKLKDILNYTVGMMQSKIIGAVFAQLSLDAISWARNRVLEIADAVRDNGGTILLFNTDGFWYKGDIYHGPGEGSKLTEWSNDHTNCTFRMASKGKYEYIQNDIYKPVVRGKTTLDDKLPRSEWVWGDIYNCSVFVARFDEEQGLVIDEEF